MTDLVCTGCGEYAGSDIAEIVGAQAAKIARLTAALEKAENSVIEKVVRWIRTRGIRAWGADCTGDDETTFIANAIEQGAWKGLTDGE